MQLLWNILCSTIFLVFPAFLFFFFSKISILIFVFQTFSFHLFYSCPCFLLPFLLFLIFFLSFFPLTIAKKPLFFFFCSTLTLLFTSLPSPVLLRTRSFVLFLFSYPALGLALFLNQVIAVVSFLFSGLFFVHLFQLYFVVLFLFSSPNSISLGKWTTFIFTYSYDNVSKNPRSFTSVRAIRTKPARPELNYAFPTGLRKKFFMNLPALTQWWCFMVLIFGGARRWKLEKRRSWDVFYPLTQ